MPCKDKIRQRAHQRKHFRSHREYYKKKRDIRYRRLVEKFHRFKAMQKCILCPEKDSVTLDFHHMGEKEDLVLRLVNNGRSWINIVKEVKECVPLCANCHRKVHKYVEWKEKLRQAILIWRGWVDINDLDW